MAVSYLGNRLPVVAALGLMAAMVAAASRTTDAARDDRAPTVATVDKAAKDDGPTWRTNFDEAGKLAAARKRPMLLRFTAEWCPPCQVMNRSVFPKQDVKKALSEKVVPVLVDIDEEENEELAFHYKVRGIPTLLLVDADGEILDRGGFMSAEELVKFIDGGKAGD